VSAEAADQFREDPALGPLVAEYGPLELTTAEDPFRRLVVAVVRQQVSTDAAAAIRGRLFDAVEVTPAGLLAADPDRLREAGLSAQKTEYVRAIATAWQDRSYDRETFATMTDEQVTAELTGIRGVGDWTAKMFLMFALGREDVFPVEDLGVRRGMEQVCDPELSRAEMRALARRWQPYRSYAALYLWRAYEG